MIYPFAMQGPMLHVAGFHPLPVVPATKRPAPSGWQRYCREPMPAEFVARYTEAATPYGTALALGCRGLVVVDIDTDQPAELTVIRGVLGPARRPLMRGRRGFAALGHDPSGRIKTRHLHGLVDVLGAGDCKVIPSTMHPSGAPYTWLAHPLDGRPPEDLPAWPEDLFSRLCEALGHESNPPSRSKPLPQAVPELTHAEIARHRAYVEAVLGREADRLGAMAAASGRNLATFRLLCRVGRWVHAGVLPRERLIQAVLDACQRNDLLVEDGHRSVLATIESGLAKSVNDTLPLLLGRAAA